MVHGLGTRVQGFALRVFSLRRLAVERGLGSFC